ncbi:hypothetical protein Tco_1177140 [Tanacetum coccineum]
MVFWKTAALSTLEDEVMGITATIDGKVKVLVFEASIRRHLKLEDFNSISSLPTAKNFEQLALMGTYPTPTLTHKLFSNMRRASKGYSGVDTPLFEIMLVQDQALHGEGPTILADTALTKLIRKVKKLEKTIKTNQARRRAKVLVFDAEEDEEDSSKQERSLIEELDLDAGISLVPPIVAHQGRFDDTRDSDQPEEQLGVFRAAKFLVDVAEQRRDVENVQTYTRRRKAVSTGSGGVSTASELVSTVGVKAKDKGKSIM